VQSFLDKVVKTILAKENLALEKCCIIVPNRRTALYLKKIIHETLNKVAFMPDFYCIDEFASLLSKLAPASHITQLILLYESYKESLDESTNASQSFDEFISWAQILLSDFNDIDSQNANAYDVFTYLSEAKAIQQWNPEKSFLTPFQKKYLAFYNSLSKIYKVFTEKLTDKKIAYQGLMYKHIINNNLYENKEFYWAHYFFIGFNAFTEAEETITDYFIKNKNAELYVDYDAYYTDNNLHEAGYHVRRIFNKWGKSNFYEGFNFYKSAPKNINIVGIPQNIGQAKFAGQLLSTLEIKNEPNHTAVILLSENMLFPMLNALPENIKDVNITMGYPLENTIIYDIFDSILGIYESSTALKKIKGKNSFIVNIKDILKITQNPFLQFVSSLGNTNTDNATLTYLFNKKLTEVNKVYYTLLEVEKAVQTNLPDTHPVAMVLTKISLLHEANSKTIALLLYEVVALIKDIIKNLPEKQLQIDMEVEFLYHYERMLNTLLSFLNEATDIEIHSFKSLHKMLVKGLRVPFTGEPLCGLQLMGLLESRNLDFKNIIMLGVNEGIMPASKTNNSFIPLDIRTHFNLPVYYHNESIYAYHFYRLLQRAENVFLLHNTEADAMGSGEQSRFVSQIQYELPLYNSQIKIKRHILSIPFSEQDTDFSLTINKTDEVIEQLKTKLQKGISPSSLSIYLQCTLRFYLQFVMGINANEEPDDTIDAAHLGTIIHDVLENIYIPLIGKELITKDISIEDANIEMLLENSFRKNLENIDTTIGKNLLLKKIAFKFIQNFLKEEIKSIEKNKEPHQKLSLLHTEKKLELPIEMETTNGPLCVNLTGKVDRIDKVGNTYRIIDYKSGVVKKQDFVFSDWEMLNGGNISAKIVQLLTYAYLYASTSNNYFFETGFISLKRPDEGILRLMFPDETSSYSKEVHEKYHSFLITVLKEMLDSEKPICQTQNNDNCKYCDFINLCHKM